MHEGILLLTIKDFQLIKLATGLEVLYGEGDVVAGLNFDHPGAGLEVRETVAR